MKLQFSDRKLEKNCADERTRQRAFGKARSTKLGVRLSLLAAAANLEELRNAPGRLHQLTGDRAGQFAMDLDGPYRLLLEPVLAEADRKIHEGGLVWSSITHVCILSIEDYHG